MINTKYTLALTMLILSGNSFIYGGCGEQIKKLFSSNKKSQKSKKLSSKKLSYEEFIQELKLRDDAIYSGKKAITLDSTALPKLTARLVFFTEQRDNVITKNETQRSNLVSYGNNLYTYTHNTIKFLKEQEQLRNFAYYDAGIKKHKSLDPRPKPTN